MVIIIVGIISSLFGKDKKEASKKNHREFDSNPRPTAQPVQKRSVKEMKRTIEEAFPKNIKEIKRAFEESYPKEVKEIKDMHPNTVKELQTTVQSVVESDTYQELLNQQEKWAREAAALEEKAIAITQVSKQASAHSKELQAFHKNELVNGLIMSEVLGPPKSKRPMVHGKR